jgi:hypothetical protein
VRCFLYACYGNPSEAGITQIRQGLAAYRATGAEFGRRFYLARLAETYGAREQPEEGLRVPAEAVTVAHSIEECSFEAGRHQLKGDLLLALSTDH